MGQLHNLGGWIGMPNIPKDIVAGPFYYAEQNGCLKIFTGYAWKMNGLERRVACLQSVVNLKKGTRLSRCNWSARGRTSLLICLVKIF